MRPLDALGGLRKRLGRPSDTKNGISKKRRPRRNRADAFSRVTDGCRGIPSARVFVRQTSVLHLLKMGFVASGLRSDVEPDALRAFGLVAARSPVVVARPCCVFLERS